MDESIFTFRVVAAIILVIMMVTPTTSQLTAQEGGSGCEIASNMLSIYFRAFSYVSNQVNASNLSTELNISIPSVPNIPNLSINKSLTVGELLDLSYSLAVQANASLAEGNCSGVSFLIKKALNLLRFVLINVKKKGNLTNQTISVGSMVRLQVAFERHKRLLLKLNQSLQRMKNLNLTSLNLTMFKQLYVNASVLLQNGSMIAFQNASAAAKLLSEANKIRVKMRKEIVKLCQVARAEKMLNRTISALNLTALPEEVKSQLSSLEEEFKEAKERGDARKVKEILREIKKLASSWKRGQAQEKVEKVGIGRGKDRNKGEGETEVKGRGKGRGKGKGKP